MKTIGDRITYCRSVLGLTRKEFSTLWGEVSIPTLSRWELDVIKPASKKILALVEFFCSKGLIVMPEWLEQGAGILPMFLNIKDFVEDDFDNICDNTFIVLNQKIQNFIYYKVTSNFFSPIIRYGDYIGGVLITDKLANINSLVFVVQDNAVWVGFLDFNDEKLILKNSQGKTMEFVNYSLIAKVNWTAIRP